MSKGIVPGATGTGTHVVSGTWKLVDGAGNIILSLTPSALTFGNLTTNPSTNFNTSGAFTTFGPVVLNGTLAVASITINGNALVVGSLTVNGAVILATALPIAQGGTAAITAAAARTNLGLGSIATLNTVVAANVSGGVLRQASLGSGVVTVQNGGSPSGGADGDIFLIY